MVKLAPPSAFDGDASTAVQHLQRYFEVRNGVPDYEGSCFERLGGGGASPEEAHAFTPTDLLAVGLLSVNVPPSATLAILGRDADVLNGLLQLVPADLDLADAKDHDIGAGSEAIELYGRLRAYRGMGKAKVSKLMARKRPRLIPIRDSRINDLLALDDEYWIPLRDLLAESDRAFHHRLVEIKERAGVGEDISAIRVWDIVCWMQASHSEG